MKVVILYRPNSEFARMVEEYATEFERQRGKKFELVDIDSEAGSNTAQLYDIVQYPAILAVREDGQIMMTWQGERLPLMDEVAAYFDQ